MDMSNVKPTIHGDFEDDEWRRAVAKKAADRSRREAQIVRRGPRDHPYSDATVHVDDSVPKVTRYFENEEHYKAYTKKHESKGPPATEALMPQGKQAEVDRAGAQTETDRANKAMVGSRPKGA